MRETEINGAGAGCGPVGVGALILRGYWLRLMPGTLKRETETENDR